MRGTKLTTRGSGLGGVRRSRRVALWAAALLFAGGSFIATTGPTGVLAGGPNLNHPASSSAESPPLNETVVWCREQRALHHTAAVSSAVCKLALTRPSAFPLTSTTAIPDCFTPCGPNVNCYASSCTNQDPVLMNCSSYASTNFTAYGGQIGYSRYTTSVSNRWSSACQANWTTEWVNQGSNQPMWAAVEYNGCCIPNRQAPNYPFCCQIGSSVIVEQGSNWQTMWTNMLDGGPGTACTSSDDANSYYWYTYCY